MQHGLALRATARSDGLITVHAAGVLDNNTLDRFEAALAKARERGAKSVVVDCDEVRYVSSAGFGELIRYHDLLKENGGVLVLARVAPKVGVILEMLGLKSLIPVVASLEEAIRIAERGEVPEPERSPEVNRVSVESPRERLPVEPRITTGPIARPDSVEEVIPAEQPAPGETEAAECIFCDARVLPGAPGSKSTCVACGAPFEVSESGGLRFEWGDEEGACDAFHLTFHMTPHGMAALAGMVEAMLADRDVEHMPTRRFSRDVVQICLLISEHAYAADERGLLHLLAVSTPERLTLRVVDRGRDLTEESGTIFESQASRLLGFEYGRLAEGVHATRFAFAWPAGESEPG